MGEAKRRRLAGQMPWQSNSSSMSREDVVKLASFIALVIDRSEAGQQALTHVVSQFPDFSERKQLWDLSGFEFLLSLRKVTGEAVATLMARDQGELLSQALPELMKRVNDAGGMCAAMLAIRPELRQEVEEEFARLTPAVRVAESASQATNATAGAESSASNAGLLNLAVAPGGREVDMSMVQILDKDLFAKFTDYHMAVAAEKMNRGDRSRPGKEHELRGWAREDGSLFIRNAGSRPFELVAAAGAWRELTPAEKTTLEREVHERMARSGGGLVKEMASALKDTAKHQQRSEENFRAVSGKAASIVTLFSRQSESLQALHATKAVPSSKADEWLASKAEYLLVMKTRAGEGALATVAGRAEVFEALEGALVMGGEPSTTLLMPLTRTDLDANVTSWWKERGGLVAGDDSRPASEIH